ncbi:MAG: DUF2089 domain-containing protein [Anaerolineales bacterium]|nr:DUF2089 domain-containing protein [Anaerolineales bacterium]
MQALPSQCPICGGEIIVSRLHCRECDVTIDGRFSSRTFSQLTPQQMDFVETFVRLEGKITHMEKELGLSYPTIRNRLHEVIRALGYEPGGEEEDSALSEAEREKILNDLDEGKISYEEAIQRIEGGEELEA